jgi:hypothetical protein
VMPKDAILIPVNRVLIYFFCNPLAPPSGS